MMPFIHLFWLTIPSYGTMMMLGMLVAGVLGIHRTIRAGLRWEDALFIGVCGVGTGLIGAGFLYGIVTYGAKQLFQLLLSGRIFTQPWGLVFYGGLLGSIPGVILAGSIAKIQLRLFVAPLLPCIPLAHAFGRMGCFLAGCCYGAPTQWPVGVIYTQSFTGVPTGIPLLPVQLWESALLFLLTVLLLSFSSRLKPQQLLGIYALLYGVFRFGLEFLRYDSIRGLWHGLSTSQWISMGILLAGVILLLQSFFTRKGEPRITIET